MFESNAVLDIGVCHFDEHHLQFTEAKSSLRYLRIVGRELRADSMLGPSGISLRLDADEACGLQ